MKRIIRYSLLLIWMVAIACGVSAQSVSFDFRPNYVLPTHAVLRTGANKKLDNEFYAFHLKYAFQFRPESYLGALYPNTRQGIGIAYNAFFNNSVGNPVAVYAFQSARIARISRQLSLSYEWNFGASFGWNPYDELLNPDNQIIGSKINAYINLGIMLDWQLSKSWTFTGGVGFSHFSNGNTHYPNAGLNSVEARVGVVRKFISSGSAQDNCCTATAQWGERPHFSYDIIVYGATRKQLILKDRYVIPGSFGIVGMNISPMYNFNKYLRAGVSLDAQYDESANLKNHIAGYDEEGKLRFYRPPLKEQLTFGLSLRGELVMPIFSINFGMGYNLYSHGDDFKGLYQILALKTHLTRNFYLHTGYQLSKFRTPKNLMLGVGYRIH